MNAVERMECPECAGTIQTANGETVCAECGLVVDAQEIDRGPQWRSDDEGSDRRHSGGPRRPDRHDRGLSTEIGFGDGSDVGGDRQRRLVRMRRQHNRARLDSTAERNRVYAYTEIRRLTSARDLPSSVREQACSLFDSAQDEGLLRGRSLEGFAAASVYAVCRTQSIARTMDEIADGARANRAELQSAYDALNRSLGLPVGPIDPVEYLPRYATELDLDSDVERRAREYAAVLVETGRMGGKNPSGVAAACLYEAATDAGADVTQIAAAEVADVSRMTIRSTADALERIDL